jgi:uncharacterized peroxidase-related enzyme
MPHIALPAEYPGVRSLFMYSPATAKPLNDLVQTLLHDPATSTLTPGERELIATYTSSLNECKYCANTHGAIAKYQLGGDENLVKAVRANPTTAPISPKLKALLNIAGKVQTSGRNVTPEDVDNARKEDPRRRTHCRYFLYVQPLCRRPGYLGPRRPGRIRLHRQTKG